MDQRKIQVSEVEAYNNKLTNIKSELESKLNSYINHLNNLSNDNAIEGAVSVQLGEFCSDIKNFLNIEVSQKLESFTNFVKKDIESVKTTDSSTASKIANILGNGTEKYGEKVPFGYGDVRPPRIFDDLPTHSVTIRGRSNIDEVGTLTQPDISQWTQ
jgi:hypothetical protein